MLSTAVPSPRTAAAGAAPRWGAWLRRAWARFTLDDDERFLHAARDLADLEARLRRLERGGGPRFGPLPPQP